ncbi:MAG: phage tail sheath family protein [Lachnospirales bacterium]
MALGGGVFLTQNKVLPGSYINFISASYASATLSDRGYVAIALELDFGVDDEVFEVTNSDFQKDSLKYFGYDYTHKKLKGLRDLFKNAKTVYVYRLNSGTKAKSDIAEAKYSGIAGNNITLGVFVNVDDNSKFDVNTYYNGDLVDTQCVGTAEELEENDFIKFKKGITLISCDEMIFSGGANKDSVTGVDYQKFLTKIENYSFNALGCLSLSPEIIDLFVEYTKRMRDEVGAKFQTVVYNSLADYEGVVSLKNKVTDSDEPENSLIYWVTGIIGGCEVNKSNTNRTYDGDFTIWTEYSQSELIKAIKKGEFVLHKVGDDVKVLEDINTFISITDTKSPDFSSNQTMRVLDQIAVDIATLFNNKYLGKVPNDSDGRLSLWNDIVKHHKTLESIRAIENFIAEEVIVAKGDTKKSVVVTDYVTPVNAMAQLYMTVIVE